MGWAMYYQIQVDVDWTNTVEDWLNTPMAAVRPYLDSVFVPLQQAFAPYFHRRFVASSIFRASELSLTDKIEEWMDEKGCKYQIVFSGCWSIEELTRARWVPVAIREVATESQVRNRYPVTLCETCLWFDETKVPDPYRVDEHSSLRKYEILPCDHGLVVVSRRVRDLLLEVVSDQVDWGRIEAVPVGKRSAAPHHDLYWIRPRYQIGPNMAWKTESPCPTCGQPRISRNRLEPSETKVFSDRVVVEHFGDPSWSIASEGNWYGNRRDPSDQRVSREVFLAGGLFAYLFNHKVKGLCVPEEGVYSTKGEPFMEARRRFDMFSRKDDRVLRQKTGWEQKEPGKEDRGVRVDETRCLRWQCQYPSWFAACQCTGPCS